MRFERLGQRCVDNQLPLPRHLFEPAERRAVEGPSRNQCCGIQGKFRKGGYWLTLQRSSSRCPRRHRCSDRQDKGSTATMNHAAPSTCLDKGISRTPKSRPSRRLLQTPKPASGSGHVPSPQNLTVREHHSLVELPDNNYKPRSSIRESASTASRFDYASPIATD